MIMIGARNLKTPRKLLARARDVARGGGFTYVDQRPRHQHNSLSALESQGGCKQHDRDR